MLPIVMSQKLGAPVFPIYRTLELGYVNGLNLNNLTCDWTCIKLMMHDMWYVFVLLTYWDLLAYPSFLSWFTGLPDSFVANLDDAMLKEHYDALATILASKDGFEGLGSVA